MADDINPVTVDALFRLVEETHKNVTELVGHVGELTGETKGIKEQVARQNGTIASVVKDVQELKMFKSKLMGLGTLIVLGITAATAIGIALFR